MPKIDSKAGYTLKKHNLIPIYNWARKAGVSGQYLCRIAIRHKVPLLRVGYVLAVDPPAIRRLTAILKK